MSRVAVLVRSRISVTRYSKVIPPTLPTRLARLAADRAGITEHVHPHTFRHQMLTWLTAQGLPDAAIQLISGHSSKKRSLAQVEPGYQKAIRQLEI